MADLLTAARAGQAGDDSPVVYLSNGPWNFTGPLSRFLSRCGFPAGPLLLTQWSPSAEGVFRDGRAHKRRSLERLRSDFPGVRWLLVGDDGEHDPAVYGDFARAHPQHVLAIALRQVGGGGGGDAAGTADGPAPDEDDGLVVPVLRGPDGHVLLHHLREAGLLGTR
nr:App1 family protein [Quadrisphaera sp. RL12-1S]